MTDRSVLSESANPSSPLTVEVAIIGAGFGGLCTAIQLLERGESRFVLLEKADEVGGTWRDNSYPGAACDVQSHLYSFSFAGKADWSQRYAPWNEIQDYILDTTRRYGLRRYIRTGSEVCAAHFDESTGHWHLNTTRGDEVIARHVVLASGPLHVPSTPRFKGIERFKGKSFHSAQWDHGYDLRGKRVISIGTGGSAIQYCPEIAPAVDKLYVLQRSPAWVIPRDTRRYPQWRKTLFARVPLLRKLHRARLYWSNESRVWPIFTPWLARRLQSLAGLFIRHQVQDPDLVRRLTPDYVLGCKRILISNKWYPMFNRANVELVDDGIAEIREHSVVTRSGRELLVDCIIYGTGFQVDPRLYMKDFPCSGLPGHELMKDWKDGSEAYLGVHVAGYPNLHQLVGPNTALGHNSIIFMIEAQVHYILESIQALRARGADFLDVRPDAQRRFNERVQDALKGTVWNSGCVSWYQQADGKNFSMWPWSTWRYWLATRHLPAHDYRFLRCSSKVTAARQASTQAEPA
ncbi:flavin-containing monooxygenase [Pseudomonas sp. B1-22]|uniref:flavin-containing monooxygenase n=1 Tax=Pseudomonas sp. B1-22 TaxID=3141456 RepID=UPI003D2A7320